MSTIHDTEWAESVDARLAKLESAMRENTVHLIKEIDVYFWKYFLRSNKR